MSLQPVLVSTREIGVTPYKSNLKTDYASGVSAITIYSISNFAINQILLIGEYGNEGSEIIKTHASTAPTGFTVTLVSATTKPHTKDTPVYILSFDQIEFSHADTLTGVKSLLGSSPYAINPEDDLMQYEDTTNTSGYYFTRYKNSITGVYSGYSDGVPYTGLPDNTVGYAIDTAMNELNAKFTDRLTFGILIGFSKQMLRLVRGKLKSWSNYLKTEQNFGTVSQGVRRFALPSAVYDQNSNKSIKSLRVGTGLPLTPIDRDEYLQMTEDVVYTEVATQAEIGATSLVLDDTSDLEDTGSVSVFKSGVKYSVEYTVNTRSTNTLTVASDQITVVLLVDSQVWQNIEESEPEYFSVQDSYVYLWPIIDSNFEGRNLTGDYLLEIEEIDSQMDVLSNKKFDLLIPYLKWKIKMINNNNGDENMNDPSYAQFRELLTDVIKNETLPESVGFRPRGRVIEGGRSALNRR